MGNFHVITTTDALYGSHACQHNFQLLFLCVLKKFLILCESANRHALLFAVTPPSH